MLAYREWAPPPALAEVVDCFWRVECRGGHGEDPATFCFPDASPAVALTVSGGWRETGDDRPAPRLGARGSSTRTARVAYSAGTVVLGVSLQPWAAPMLEVAPRDAVDGRVDLTEAWGPSARRLAGMTQAATETEVERALTAEIQRRADGLDLTARHVVEPLLRADIVRVDAAAAALGFSRQHLRRLAVRHTGLTPKRLATVARFQRVLEACLEGGGDWAAAAAEFGYADQSHLIADFRRFAGRTPDALRRGFSISPAGRC